MKRIIDGLRYDTEAPRTQTIGKATNIGNGADNEKDFQYWAAGLFVTGGGRYFLSGIGGPMSPYGHPTGKKSWSMGEKIIPLEKKAAQEWAEKWLPTQIVETYFSDITSDI